jgi:hypothetical protein
VGPGLWRDSTAIVRDFNEKKLAIAARADIAQPSRDFRVQDALQLRTLVLMLAEECIGD